MVNIMARFDFLTFLLLAANHAPSLAQLASESTDQFRRQLELQRQQDNYQWPGALPVSFSVSSGQSKQQKIHQVSQQHPISRSAAIVKPANNFNDVNPTSDNFVHRNPNWLDAINLNPQPNQLENALVDHDNGHRKSLKGSAQSAQWQNTNSPTHNAADHQGSSLASNLELALRQASGDESVFQPSPTLGTTNHESFDWMSGASSSTTNQGKQPSSDHTNSSRSFDYATPMLNSSIKKPQHEDNLVVVSDEHQAKRLPSPTAAAGTSTSTTTPTTTTTFAVASNLRTSELNNQVLQNQAEPAVVLNHQQSVSSPLREYQVNGSTSLEFNNQVIHEGPATPPSGASADDYYFSASSISNNKELANDPNEPSRSNAWWALGLSDELERVNNLTRDDYLSYCDTTPLLINSKQRSMCRLHPRVMSVVARGLRMAMDECQAKFATSRWNCSLIVHDLSTWSANGDLDLAPAVFGDVMRRPNRERSFLNAIIAAGLAHSMTKACSQNELPEECSCDRKIKSRNNKGRIEWVACSDDIDYGARFSRDFTDNFDPNESDATSTTYMHNSEVGRRVFKSATDITCTCLNGESGLCQTKRCWKHLGTYADVVDELIKRYEGATHVQRSNRDPHKLRPVRRGVRKPKRKDLVYIDESPDYCQKDTRFGVLGTQNRLCNSTSHGRDSCSLLCCGRGFQSVVEQVEEDCNCKFVWCCQVKCDKCKRFVTNEICN